MNGRRESRRLSPSLIAPRSTLSRSSFSVHRSSLVFKSPWGWIVLTASPRGITRVALAPRTRPRPARRGQGPARPQDQKALGWLNQARRELQAYLLGKSKTFSCRVDLTGATPFQRAVWRVTAQVPYGRVRSYQWIAAKLGVPRSARAVGNALGANPVPMLIPCHRIVAGDASLGGFSCGLSWKRRLLALEGSLPALRRSHG